MLINNQQPVKETRETLHLLPIVCPSPLHNTRLTAMAHTLFRSRAVLRRPVTATLYGRLVPHTLHPSSHRPTTTGTLLIHLLKVGCLHSGIQPTQPSGIPIL